MVFILKYVYAVTWFLVVACEESIRWNLSTQYIVVGSDAKLICHAPSCPIYTIKQWFGGKHNSLLGFDGTSANPAKYEMIYNVNGYSFDLMIKNFSLTDANCMYTCACGFLQYTNMLKLEDFDIIYPPKVYRYSNKTKESSFELDIAMIVYPRPTCEVTYQDAITRMYIKVTDDDLEGEIFLKRVLAQHVIKTVSHSCKGNFTITCQVGLMKFTLGDGQLDLCKGEPSTKESTEISSASVSVSVIGIVCVVVVFLLSMRLTMKK